MSTHKTRIPRLSEQQYKEYVETLKNDPALYNADGTIFVPERTFDTNDDEETNK